MPLAPEDLLRALTTAGIAAETHWHRPVFTVAESRSLHSSLPGGHTKNLFLRPAKGKGPYLLVTLEAERRVSINILARQAGVGRVEMASPAELEAVLGVPPGSVTPFALLHAAPGAVRFAIDRCLIEGYARIWVHPLTNRGSTGLAPEDLLRFLSGYGHQALVLDLDGN